MTAKILFMLLILLTVAHAEIINVPDDFETIHGAINESEDGDTVLVQPGEYRENIVFGGKAITVASLILTTDERAYIDSTIIDGRRNDCVVSFMDEEDTTSILQGFTIRNGYQGYGGGIDCQGTSPMLIDLLITGNTATSIGGGVYCNGSGNPQIRRSIIEENEAPYGGGLCNNPADISLSDVIIRRNIALLGGGGLYLNAGTAILEYVIIVGNEVGNGDGGAISNICSEELILNNVTITQNSAARGGGIMHGSGSGLRATVINSIVTNNTNEEIFVSGANRNNPCIIAIAYSDIEGGEDEITVREGYGEVEWGEGNIDEDPSFVDPNGDDYNLSYDSPCIDTGDPDSPLDPDGTRADMGAMTFEHLGIIEGFVLDLIEDDPLVGAIVSNQFGYTTRTDDEGFFIFNSAPDSVLDITASHPGYNDLTLHDQQVDDDDTLRIVFRLTHPVFSLSEEQINESLDSGDSTEVDLTITNRGNGQLEWQSEKRLIGESGVDPWELRRSYSVSDTVNDARVEGVVFVDDQFYVSGSNIFDAEDGDNMIYVLDLDGHEINRFRQFGESRYGMRDLAWDGELIWGCSDNMVIGFTTEGDSITAFEGLEYDLSSIAWDPDREVLWVARKTGRGIYAYNTEGNCQDTLSRCGFRLFGLAYWQDDPDGYNLYILHSPNNITQLVHKMNTETGDTMFVATLEPEAGGQPGGVFITNTYDPRCWVFVSIANNSGDDRIDIWQIESNTSWMTLEPISGEIEAESSQDLTLSIFTEGLPVDFWEGELVFNHNAAGGETVLPVTLTIRPDAVEEGDNLLIPDEFAITSIYPNPFNSTTMITYSLPVASAVELRLFDLTGREVASLVNEFKQAGIHSTALSATDLPSGMYFVKLAAVNQSITKKILLIR